MMSDLTGTGNNYFTGNKRIITVFMVSIYTLSLLLFCLINFSINYVLYKVLWVIAIGCFVGSSYLLFNDFKFKSRYFKIIFSLFMLYECIIVFRGILFNISYSLDNIWDLLNSNAILWPFLIPLFVFFCKDIYIHSYVFDWIIKFGIIFIFLCIFFPKILLDRNQANILVGSMTFGCGYLLLFATYINNRKVNIAFIVLTIGILSLTYLARRSGMFTLTGLLVAAYLLNIKNSAKPVLFRIFPIIIIIGVIGFMNAPSLNLTLTNRLQRRLTEDTRSSVFEMYFVGMNDDMVFGKGMNGTYFCPIGGEDEEEGVVWADVDYREIIENGYLQLILTGGILHLVLFILILLPAAIFGIFKSSNQFTRACGLVIFLQLLDMFLFGLPTLSLHYILVWICVGICYNPEMRNKLDFEIRKEFRQVT